MGTFIELSSNFIQIFVLTLFITKSFGFKHQGNFSKAGFVSAWFLTFAELSLINHIAVYDGFLSVVVILTLVIYAWCFLKGKFFHHVFLVLFSMAIVFTLASITIFFFSYLSGFGTETLISEFTYHRIAMLLICRTLEILIFKFVLKLNSEYALTKKEWFLFAAMPLLTWAGITFATEATIEASEVMPQMFYIALIMVFINVIIYFFMYKIKKDTKTKIEYELLKMQYNNIKNTGESMKVLYDSVYCVKHDLEKHLLAIKAIAEKDRCEDINDYINNIFDEELNSVQKIIFTDNDIFNAVINTKLELCKKKSLFPSINISNDAVNCIKSSDIAVLFGNIFDNAIEAAEKTNDRIIILNVKLQGEYISVYMENSFDERYSDINLKTTKDKKSEHGYGTKNVQRIVDEYDGMIQYFKNEAGMFCCDILLKKKD